MFLLITKKEVLEYLDTLSSIELEDVFKNFIEYTDNIELEDEICSLQVRIDELEEHIECLKYSGGYYE